jgi:hypothetical protein
MLTNNYRGPWPPSNALVKKTVLTHKFEKEGIMTKAVKEKTVESTKMKEILNKIDERYQYVDTPAYKHGYSEGESQGDYLSEEYHKEMIYRLVKAMTMDIKNNS